MYYKVVEYYGPNSKEQWQGYIDWSGLTWLKSFDSIDGMLRPDLFTPTTNEDWANCANVNNNCLIANIHYAIEVHNRIKNSILIGVDLVESIDYIPEAGIAGFDIIDGDNHISVLTNWGNQEGEFNRKLIADNGLILDKSTALQIRDKLRNLPNGDSHSEACNVWAVYHLDDTHHVALKTNEWNAKKENRT